MSYDYRPWKHRFWSKVKIGEFNDCWEWLGSKIPTGYGVFKLNNVNENAHRVMLQLSFGPLKEYNFCGERLVVDHLCKNKGCVNPNHLELVTNSVNMLRATIVARNSKKTHCKMGHPFSGENLYYTYIGSRGCRICKNASNREYKVRAKQNDLG